MRSIKRTKRCREKPLNLNCLPNDLIVEIIAHVVSVSSTPLIDLETLRITCKKFYEASKTNTIGRSISLGKELALHWSNKRRYVAILERCASVGNSEANFILGLEEICNMGRKNSGLRHLKKAMMGGHDAAAYLMGIIMFKDPATQSLGMELMNKLTMGDEIMVSGSPKIARCRNESVSILRKMTMKRFQLMIRGDSCTNLVCGRVVSKVDEWLDEEGVCRSFCSQFCRWTHEYNNFCKLI